MNDPIRQIYLVDDDPAILQALSRLLRSAGYEPIGFTSAKDFIKSYHPEAQGCLVLDFSMPGITGLELQQWLVRSNSPLPIIFLTARGDIPGSVQAMKLGAVDYLIKPVTETDLLKAIQEASRRAHEASAERAQAAALHAKLQTLTPRERQVLEHVVAGQPNKWIATELGTVEKTVKVHRGRVMQKLGAKSLADLVRMAGRAGIGSLPLYNPNSVPTSIPSKPPPM